jgi:hypothetical protein
MVDVQVPPEDIGLNGHICFPGKGKVIEKTGYSLPFK